MEKFQIPHNQRSSLSDRPGMIRLPGAKYCVTQVINAALFISITSLPAPLCRGSETYSKGTPAEGAAGIRERTSDIMERQRKAGASSHVPKIHPAAGPNFQNLPASPDSPNVASWPPGASAISRTPKTPQLLGLNFTGATLPETEFSFPPDSMGAAGPSQFIVAVNGRIRSFNKVTGVADGAINANTDVFFSSVLTPPISSNFTSDPRSRYDRLSGRWFVTMVDVPGFSGTAPNRVLIAVSDSGTITANSIWTFYYFQADASQFGDYDTLGIDANALYIAVNLFGSRGLKSSFGGSTAFVVRKSSILNGGPIVVTTFANLIRKVQGSLTGPYSPQGADNYDPAATEGYFIGVDVGVYGKLQLRRVSDPGGTPSISSDITITIPLNGATITVPHLGNTAGVNGYLNAGDYRLLGAHLRNGHLWTTENIGVDNTGSAGGTDTRMGVRWYDLDGIASGQTPSVHQSGTVYQPSASNTTDQRSYWMGSITVSGQGHAAMGFSVAGANEYANAGTVGRLANDPLGTLRTPVLYTASSTAYNPSGDTGGASGRRWGDFSFTSLDPSDDMTMWTIQEFCNTTDSYGVQVVRLLAPPPAIPTLCSPATLTNGVSGINVLLTGTTNGDTGFFDPGPGFSNHISGSISGSGVTINNITYTDPTHLTLNLSVASGAATGGRTVTITNPDGQNVTSGAAILTIVGVPNSGPVLAPIPDRTNNELTLVTFTNSATDPNGKTLTFSLDPGFPAGAAIDPSTGVFSWTPSEAQGPGTYLITVQVTENGPPALSASNSFTITVLEVNSPPILAPVGDRTVHAGTTVIITNSATDTDIPTNHLTFSISSSTAPGAGIDPLTGVFSWATTDALINANNTFAVTVTDDGTPPLSDTKSFNVKVVARPMIQSIVRTNNGITIVWSSIAGQSYRLEYKQNLSDSSWTSVSPDIAATGPTATTTDSPVQPSHRFYRVEAISH